MEEQRSYAGPVIVGAILLVIALIAAYSGGYFLLARFDGDFRIYNEGWQATIFKPGGYIEGALTQRNIEATSGDEYYANGNWR